MFGLRAQHIKSSSLVVVVVEMRQEYGCDDADDGARENERVRAYIARRWYTDKDDANDLQKRGQTRTKGMKKRR